MSKILFVILGLALVGMTYSTALFTCSSLTEAPTKKEDCTGATGLASGEKCCYVETSPKICYKKPASISDADWKVVTDAWGTGITFDCSSSYISFSFVIALIAVLLF